MSCQAKIAGDLVIDVPVDTQTNQQVVRKRAETRRIKVDSAIQLVAVNVSEPDMETPRGDVDRLREELQKQIGIDALEIDFTLIPQVQTILRKGQWTVTVAIHTDADKIPVAIALWPGEKQKVYGLAVDIGSTTIAAHLCDFVSGRTVSSAGTSNPQIRFGEDLMSRVSYIQMQPDKLPSLTQAVRDAVNSLIGKLVGDVGARREDVLEAVFVVQPSNASHFFWELIQLN